MVLDLGSVWNMLVQVVQQFSNLSSTLGGFTQQWTQLVNQLPPETTLWFTLGVFSTVGYGLASMSAKVCKILMIVFWAIFIIFLVKAELHL